MKTSEFEFAIGANVTPAEPPERRGRSRDSGRLVVLDRAAGSVSHLMFPDILDHLRPGDLLVLNDSYILPDTLACRAGDEKFELTVHGHEPDGTSIVEIRPNRGAGPGLVLRSADDGELGCTVLARLPDRLWRARFAPARRLVPALERFGRRADRAIAPGALPAGESGYCSVYAKAPGSLEIPSAGLHFSTGLLEAIAGKGVETAFVTLHVGASEVFTARHIQKDDVEDHRMRAEYFEVGEKAAAQVSRAKAEGRRVVAVGTTVIRTLETLALGLPPAAPLQARSGWTDLYIYPGFRFGVVDALLTNLHRPRSSHIVLTAAFAGKDLVMRGYSEIAAMGGYEFDMFGDSMLIV
jgi:S-adenosylmethionine:tRNA ribosyltransferase-isomerase